MAGIPRFEAQIGRISVPTMQNFQQEQNEQIYRAVAGVAEKTANVAEQMYAMQKADEAQREGLKATKDTDLSQLPTAATRAQEIYNNAAIASYAADVHGDSIGAINTLANQYQDNPEQFRKLAYTDLESRTQNAGPYAKKIQEPMIKKIEAEYASMIGKNATRNIATQKEVNDYNIVSRIRQLSAKAPGTSRDIDAAAITADIETLVVAGQMSSDRATKLTQMIADVSLGEKIANIMTTTDIKERGIMWSKIINGQTGVPSLDGLSMQERIKGASLYFEDYNKKIEYEKNVGSEQIKLTTSALLQKELAAHPEIQASIPKISYGQSDYENDIAKGTLDGSLPVSSAIEAIYDDYQNRRISHEQFIANLKSFDDAYKSNVGNQYITSSISAIQDAMPDRFDSGVLVGENQEKQYIVNRLNQELHKRPYTNEEFSDLKERVIKEAKTMYNDSNRYKSKYTIEAFKQVFPQANIINIASKYDADTQVPPTNWFSSVNVDISTPEGYKNRTAILVEYLMNQGFNNSEAQMMADFYLKVKKGELDGTSRNTNR